MIVYKTFRYKDCCTFDICIHLVDNCHFYKGDNFGDFLLGYFTQYSPSEKGIYSKRKEFALGSKFFPLRIDPFSEGE